MMTIPKNKELILRNIVNELKRIENIAAIVLGGSYSTGMANENSDLDIGIYYHETKPFDIEQIKILAKKFNIDNSFTVTDFYEWGAWVNGGAWLETESGEVDLVYRNIEQVEATIENAVNGIFENDFEQQPPYGFSSVIYLAETYYCISLFDPKGILAKLKKKLNVYPEKLKQNIIRQSLWAAEFSLWQADKFVDKSDIFNSVGCFVRALKKIFETLFAINEIYPIGDKNSLIILERTSKHPENLCQKVESILNINKGNLALKAKEIRNLFNNMIVLTDGIYEPYYKL